MGLGSAQRHQTDPPCESVTLLGRSVLRSCSVIWPSSPALRSTHGAPPPTSSSSASMSKGAHHAKADTAAPS